MGLWRESDAFGGKLAFRGGGRCALSVHSSEGPQKVEQRTWNTRAPYGTWPCLYCFLTLPRPATRSHARVRHTEAESRWNSERGTRVGSYWPTLYFSFLSCRIPTCVPCSMFHLGLKPILIHPRKHGILLADSLLFLSLM